MKKALIIIFSLIAVLAVVMLVWNFVFGGNVIEGIFNAFGGRINDMWQAVTGDENSTLIPEMSTTGEGDVIDGWGGNANG